MILRRVARALHRTTALASAVSLAAAAPLCAALPAFPGAVGQGAATVGGRGGDVYHVTNLSDYDTHKDEPQIPGSLRHAIQSATGPRIIVFDVGGPIKLAGRLEIRNHYLTIAGQTAPGGVTLWGYPLDVNSAHDIVIRYLRVRTGDFNAAAPPAGTPGANFHKTGSGNADLDANTANGLDIARANNVIVDHVSAAWGMDETLSVTISRNVTVQNSIIAESLNHSFHPKGDHGYGTLVRGEVTPADQEKATGGYTFYGNLWVHHMARNPSFGGQQRLDPGQAESERHRTDVNLVNNVIFGWGDRPTHRNELGEVRANLVGNYYINGPAKKSAYIFMENLPPARTIMYQRGNVLDADQDGTHNGKPIDTPDEVARTFQRFDKDDVLRGPPDSQPLNFFAGVVERVVPAEEAYARIVRSVGASLWRDAVDRRVIDSLVHRTGTPINSQEIFRDPAGVLPGIDDLPSTRREPDFDTDADGMPDEFERRHELNPRDPADRNGTDLSKDGYTNLEVYLNELVDSP
jgi:hypothetical protein